MLMLCQFPYVTEHIASARVIAETLLKETTRKQFEQLLCHEQEENIRLPQITRRLVNFVWA